MLSWLFTSTMFLSNFELCFLTCVPCVALRSLQPEWLAACGTPLAVFSPPLLEPAPAYAPPPTDSVMAWHDVTYGRHMWPLPRCLRPHPEPATRAAVFAGALLEGRVVPGFAGGDAWSKFDWFSHSNVSTAYCST